MSLAWSTIAVLVLLLPGVLFFVGLQQSERFGRDAGGNPFLQLAGIVLVAVTFHGAYFVLVDPLACGPNRLPCVDLEMFFRVLRLDGERDRAQETMKQVAQNLHDYRLFILAYLVATPCVALRVGMRCGRFIVEGKSKWLRRIPTRRLNDWVGRRAKKLRELGVQVFWKHRWTYDLNIRDREGNPVLAFVLTRIREAERVVIYRGFLREFFVDADGKINYLVLRGVSRYYLMLEQDSIKTSKRDSWRTVGSGEEFDIQVAEGGKAITIEPTDDEDCFMVIQGSEIENVVFDRLDITESAMEEFKRILKEQVEKGVAAGFQKAFDVETQVKHAGTPESPGAAAPATDGGGR